MKLCNNCENIIIYGAGRGGRIVKEILQMQNYNILGFIDDDLNLKGINKFGLKVLGDFETLDNIKVHDSQVKVIISIAAPNLMKIREKIFFKLKSKVISFTNAVHPNAYISSSAEIGVNNIISPGVIIEAGTKLGDNNRICLNASIDHDCNIGNSNFVGANSYISSCCTIENNSVIKPFSNIAPFNHLKSGVIL